MGAWGAARGQAEGDGGPRGSGWFLGAYPHGDDNDGNDGNACSDGTAGSDGNDSDDGDARPLSKARGSTDRGGRGRGSRCFNSTSTTMMAAKHLFNCGW